MKTKKLAFSANTYVRPPCIVCKGDHRLFYCQAFKDMKPHDSLHLVKKHKLCENCLLSNHVTLNCRKPSVCSVEGCGQKHTKFIHVNQTKNVSNAQVVSNEHVVDGVKDSVAHHVKIVDGSSNTEVNVHIPIVKVRVNNKIDVLALLDTASTSTFCTKDLVDKLGVKGSGTNFQLCTLNRSQNNENARMVSLKLESSQNSESLYLPSVYVIEKIPLKQIDVDMSKYSHLSDIAVCTTDINADIDILIGQDNAEALIPLEIRKGQKGEPFATRTMFGWSFNGPARPNIVSHKVISNFITTSYVKADMTQSWNSQDEGINEDGLSWSQEDKRVIDLWNRERKLVDGHYQIPIPWRDEKAIVPNNFCVAMSRLKSLNRSLEKKKLTGRYNE